MYSKSQHSDEKSLNYIKDLYPTSRNLSLKVIVIQVSNSYKTKDGNEVRSCKVADKTGSVNLSIWGEYGNFVQPSDILSLSRCYAVMFKNSLTLYVGKQGTMKRVGEFCMSFNENPDLSDVNIDWGPEHTPDKAGGINPPSNYPTNNMPQPPVGQKGPNPGNKNAAFRSK